MQTKQAKTAICSPMWGPQKSSRVQTKGGSKKMTWGAFQKAKVQALGPTNKLGEGL